MTSTRVMKIREHSNRIGINNVWSRAACSCGDPDHDIMMDINIDNLGDEDTVYLAMYADFLASERAGVSKLQKIWWRVKTAVKILLFGYLESDFYFSLEGADQVDDFCNAIKDAQKQLALTVDKRNLIKNTNLTQVERDAIVLMTSDEFYSYIKTIKEAEQI